MHRAKSSSLLSKLKCYLALSLCFLAFPVNSQITNGSEFWYSCGQPTNSDEFASCMAIINGVVLYTMMEGSDVELCREDRLSLPQLAQQIGELGLQGRLTEFSDLEPEYLVWGALLNAYSCEGV